MNRLKGIYGLVIALILVGSAQAQGIDKEAYKHYINPDLYGEFVDGFIVTKDNERIETKIRYEYPTSYQIANHPLIILNEKGKEKKVEKAELIGFGIQDKVYVPEMLGGKIMWLMLLVEGAVQQTIFFQPYQDRPDNYYAVSHIVTHNPKEESMYIGHLAVNFNLKMSKFLDDNPEMAAKILAKEKGYHFVNYAKIVAEYNLWYNKQHPGEVTYILPVPNYEEIIANDVGKLVKEEN